MRIRTSRLYMGMGLMVMVSLLMVSCPGQGGESVPANADPGDVEFAEPCPPDCDAIDPGNNIPEVSGSVCGAACDPSIGMNCVGGLECISGTCLNADLCMGCGQTCNSDADCPAEFECTGDNICYNKSLCQGADPATCGNTCTGDLDCAPGLECYQTEQGYCWEWDPNDSCTGPGCGDACNVHSDCGGGLTCIVWGYCGGTHSSVCDGCGASCETSADCPGTMECISDGYHPGNICWSEATCEPSEFQFPEINLDLVVTEVLIDPESGFPIDPISGFPIDPILNLPIDPFTGNPFEPTTCVDDGVCTGGEQSNGSCRDCSTTPVDSCGVPCPSGVCGGGLTCANGVCWDAGFCGPGEPPPDEGGDDGGGPECTCQCVDFASGTSCADTCTGAICRP